MPAKNVHTGINDQIAMEFHAAYLYLSMAAYFEAENLPGFAAWMRHQYQEEVSHAMRLFDFLVARGVKVELQAIAKPETRFTGPLDVMKKALAHEKKVTASITKLYEAAQKEKNYPAQLMLEWFIKEQQEEEKTAGDVIARLEMAGTSGAAMLMMDRAMGSRGGES
jgi:ferritin